MAYSNNAADAVYNYIVDKIKDGEWLPGSKIATEAQLCKELDVSRIAVRQGIEKLAALSVLRKAQGSGTYVEHFEKSSILGLPFYANNKENVLSILEFRRMFDSYNAELFINKCTQAQIDELEQNYSCMKNSVDDMEKFRLLDNEFHSLIAKGTKNAIIMQISNLFTDVLSNHQTYLYQNVGPEHAIEYHGLILECIKQKNFELASIYSRIHIENSIKKLELLNERV